MPTRQKPGSKADRDSLRSEMRAAGATIAAVATEMRTRWGMRPREAWRHAHGWSLQEAADRVNDASSGSATAAYTDASQLGKWEKWPAPASRRPSLAILALLGETYGCTVEDLLDLEDRRHMPDEDLRLLRRSMPPVTSTAPAAAPRPAELTGTDLVDVVASESSAWALWAEAGNVGEVALEQIFADIRALAVDYLTGDPMTMLQRIRRLRDRVFALLEGHQPPRQATDLHVAAGYLCGLLAWTTSDLGQSAAADTHGRTAWLCAELSGHDGLRAWASSTRSKIAFWDRRYRDAVTHARRGSACTVPGTVNILLACQEADAWVGLGAYDEARAALARAAAAQERAAGADEIGGLFSCDAVRTANYSAGVHLHTGAPADALAEADTALQQMALMTVRAYGTRSQLHISRAAAHIALGTPEGAVEALVPVLSLPPEQRLDTVTRRLQSLAGTVAGSRFAGAPIARDLQCAVEVYCRESAPRIALSPTGVGAALITG